jgi:hypothetical protein
MELKDIPEDGAINVHPQDLFQLLVRLCPKRDVQIAIAKLIDTVINSVADHDSMAMFVTRDRKSNSRTSDGWREDDVIRVSFWGFPEKGTVSDKNANKYLLKIVGFVLKDDQVDLVILPLPKDDLDVMQPPANTH